MFSKKNLLSAGIIGPILFVLLYTIAGTLQEDYRPFIYPISSLAIGKEFGWIQTCNFIITGLCIITFAIGLRMQLRGSYAGVTGPLFVGLAGIGLICAGIFPTDPIFGYPPDLPFLTRQYTVHGHLHNALSMLVFIGLPIACSIFRVKFQKEGEYSWVAYCVFSAVFMILMFILAGFGFEQYPVVKNFAGIFQRMSVLTGWLWMALLARHFIRLQE